MEFIFEALTFVINPLLVLDFNVVLLLLSLKSIFNAQLIIHFNFESVAYSLVEVALIRFKLMFKVL
jgi:hypothetical protein